MKVRFPLFCLPPSPTGVITILFCLLLFAIASPLHGASETERQKEKTTIGKKIKKSEINIRRLEKGIEKQEEEIVLTQQQERELLVELQEIDTRLYEQKAKLLNLEAQIAEQQRLISEKNDEVELVGLDKQAVQNHLQKRIQAYYKMGEIGFVNVTFSTRTLPELLDFHESFQSMIKYDQSVIEQYRQSIKALQDSIETLEIEKALLEEFSIRIKEKEENITLIKNEKEALLQHIKTQTQLHEKAIEELKAARKALTASLKKLKKKDELLDQTFLLNKGNMPPPVSGELLAGFQQEVTNRLGIKTTSQGIAIKAPSGTPVRAVHEGVISYAGYLRGYGNTVIVNHGYQYYSISSRLEQIYVKKGEKVTVGTEIGIMGDTATLMIEGLYFEIRNDSKPLDPLAWLDTAQLTEP